MASSRKSSRSDPARAPLAKEGGRAGGYAPFAKGGGSAGGLAARVAAQLAPIVAPRDRLTVGLSGGVDSVVLLDCLRRAARSLHFRLAAFHVNHQLNPRAASWLAFCRRLCAAQGIPFSGVKIHVRRGKGVEAGAREARYAAFFRQACDYIVLAHHRDDQVETFLLQLLRGAGIKGLAAMPVVRRLDGGRPTTDASVVGRQLSPAILRPLLDATRDEILEYARSRGLKWIEDDSNEDIHFRRNYLRHEVLPRVARRFPSYRATIARASRHLAEAGAILDEVAAADGARFLKNGTLAVEALRRLPPERARNLLRYFLEHRGVAMPATEHLGEALRQLVSAKQDAVVAIRVEGATLRRYEGRAYVVRAGKIPRDFRCRWRGEKDLALPALEGVMTFARGRGRGISFAQLQGNAVTVRLRQGGERLQPDRRRPRRSLKNLLQEAGMPPWCRERLPLLFHGELLVWAPGIGVDLAYQAKRGEAAVLPAWTVSAET